MKVKMAKFTKETGNKARSMDTEYINGLMAAHMKANMSMENVKVRAEWYM